MRFYPGDIIFYPGDIIMDTKDNEYGLISSVLPAGAEENSEECYIIMWYKSDSLVHLVDGWVSTETILVTDIFREDFPPQKKEET